MAVAGLRAMGDVALEHGPVRLAGEKRVPLLVVAIGVEHGDAPRVLTRRIISADRAHAVVAPVQLEAIDRNIVRGLEVEA